MKKLILLLVLLPALCWGMNPYIAGIASSSEDESGYTTTVFLYNFDVPDGSDPTSVGAPTDTWDSETDADGDGNISGNAYVCTVDDGNPVFLFETLSLTAPAQIQISFTFKVSSIDLLTGTYQSTYFIDADTLKVGFRRGSGDHLDSLSVLYYDDSGSHQATPAFSWAANTEYTVTLTWETASSDGANNGVARVTINDVNYLDETTLDNDTQTPGQLIVGYDSEPAGPGDIIYDSVEVKSK